MGQPCGATRSLLFVLVLTATTPGFSQAPVPGPTFSEHSYGFRPERSGHQAVAQAQRYVAEGFDLEDLFIGKKAPSKPPPKPPPKPKPETIVPPIPTERAPPEAEGIRFVLNDIQIDGMTVYSKQDLAPVFENQLGKEISLAQIYEIALGLTVRYRKDGYILSQVVVPPQRIREGVVRLQAIEGYVDQVKFEGDGIDRPNLLGAYADKIKASRPLRLGVLERYLLLLNELPEVVVERVTLSPAERQPGPRI